MAMRHRRLLKRYQLADLIRDLGMTDSGGKVITRGVDVLGKYETGQRKPGLDTMRVLCAALKCAPEELMPGGPVITLPKAARDRKNRLDHNQALRDFATPRGLRYKNPKTGRVYYRKELKEAYARYVALDLALMTGTENEVRAARAAYEEALAAVPRAPGTESEDETELLAS
jgi:transcriptional regulator with XRE-family HTH domain